MKRNFLALTAVILAIAVSSFTVLRTTNIYFVYGSGDQTVRANYTETSSAATHSGANNVLAWIMIEDVDATVSDQEFIDAFEGLDTVSDGDNTLNDDSQKRVLDLAGNQFVTLEKKP
jgi:hypothetical protein